jgi:hypothetical protein
MRTVLLITALLFSGCSPKPVVEPKKIYIKENIPRLRVLYKVEPFTITDYYDINATYYSVNKKELHKASEVSQKVRHKVDFYERQNIQFNKEFNNENK